MQAPRLVVRSLKALQAAAASQAAGCSGDALQIGLGAPPGGWLASTRSNSPSTPRFVPAAEFRRHCQTAALGLSGAPSRLVQQHQLFQQQASSGQQQGTSSWGTGPVDSMLLSSGQALGVSGFDQQQDEADVQRLSFSTAAHEAGATSAVDFGSPAEPDSFASYSSNMAVGHSTSGGLHTTASDLSNHVLMQHHMGQPMASQSASTLQQRMQMLVAMQQQAGAGAASMPTQAAPAVQAAPTATRPVVLADYLHLYQHLLPSETLTSSAPQAPPPMQPIPSSSNVNALNTAAALMLNRQQQFALYNRLQQQQQQQQQVLHVPPPPAPFTLSSTQHTNHMLAVLQQQQLQQQQQQQQQRGNMQQQQGLPGHHPPHMQTFAAAPLPSRGTSRSISLNKDITSTTSIDQLLALVKAHGHEFDFFNISTAVSRVPKLAGAEGLGPHHHHSHAQHHNHHALATQHGAMLTTTSVTMPYSGFGATMPPAASAGGSFSSAAPAGAGSSASAAPGCSHHLPAPVHELADRLCDLVLRHIHQFDGRGLANTAWAFAKLRYVPDPALPPALCRAAVRRVDEFAAQNTANLAWALVYMHYQDQELMLLLKRKALQQVREMKPQELANMMWALASHEQLDHHTARVLGSRAATLAGHFKEQELSNVVWALGRAQYLDLSLLEPLLVVVRARLPAFMPQGISNMLWALGQLRHHDEALMAALARECGRNLHAYDAQALSNLAAGLAALGGPHSVQLMASVAHEAAARGARMAPQHLAAVLGAAATHGAVNVDRLVMAAIEMLHTRGTALEPSTLISLTSAALTLDAPRQLPGSPAAALMEPLAAALVAAAEKLQGQALVSVVTHCAQLGPAFAAATLPALAQRMPTFIQSLTPQQAAAVTSGLQQAGALSADLMPCLLSHAVTSCTRADEEGFTSAASELSAALQAAASVAFRPDGTTQDTLRMATQVLLPHLTPQQLCGTCWALAALGVLDSQLLSTFLTTLDAQGAQRPALTSEMMQQLLDAHVMVAAKHGSSNATAAGAPVAAPAAPAAPSVALPGSVRDLVRELTQHQQQQQQGASALAQQLSMLRRSAHSPPPAAPSGGPPSVTSFSSLVGQAAAPPPPDASAAPSSSNSVAPPLQHVVSAPVAPTVRHLSIPPVAARSATQPPLQVLASDDLSLGAEAQRLASFNNSSGVNVNRSERSDGDLSGSTLSTRQHAQLLRPVSSNSATAAAAAGLALGQQSGNSSGHMLGMIPSQQICESIGLSFPFASSSAAAQANTHNNAAAAAAAASNATGAVTMRASRSSAQLSALLSSQDALTPQPPPPNYPHSALSTGDLNQHDGARMAAAMAALMLHDPQQQQQAPHAQAQHAPLQQQVLYGANVASLGGWTLPVGPAGAGTSRQQQQQQRHESVLAAAYRAGASFAPVPERADSTASGGEGAGTWWLPNDLMPFSATQQQQQQQLVRRPPVGPSNGSHGPNRLA